MTCLFVAQYESVKSHSLNSPLAVFPGDQFSKEEQSRDAADIERVLSAAMKCVIVSSHRGGTWKLLQLRLYRKEQLAIADEVLNSKDKMNSCYASSRYLLLIPTCRIWQFLTLFVYEAA